MSKDNVDLTDSAKKMLDDIKSKYYCVSCDYHISNNHLLKLHLLDGEIHKVITDWVNKVQHKMDISQKVPN